MPYVATGLLADAEYRHYRARVAALSRDRKPNDPELLAARRAMALAFVEERVRTAVKSAPPLPQAVRERLVELIRSVNGEASAA